MSHPRDSDALNPRTQSQNANHRHSSVINFRVDTEPHSDSSFGLAYAEELQPEDYNGQNLPTQTSSKDRLSLSLMESLIKSAARSRLENGSSAITSADFDEQDVKLLELLVCKIERIGLQLLHCSVPGVPLDSNSKMTGLLRSRLNAARQALEGELDK